MLRLLKLSAGLLTGIENSQRSRGPIDTGNAGPYVSATLKSS